jgi:uncharacterized membrane protein
MDKYVIVLIKNGVRRDIALVIVGVVRGILIMLGLFVVVVVCLFPVLLAAWGRQVFGWDEVPAIGIGVLLYGLAAAIWMSVEELGGKVPRRKRKEDDEESY